MKKADLMDKFVAMVKEVGHEEFKQMIIEDPTGKNMKSAEIQTWIKELETNKKTPIETLEPTENKVVELTKKKDERVQLTKVILKIRKLIKSAKEETELVKDIQEMLDEDPTKYSFEFWNDICKDLEEEVQMPIENKVKALPKKVDKAEKVAPKKLPKKAKDKKVEKKAEEKKFTFPDEITSEDGTLTFKKIKLNSIQEVNNLIASEERLFFFSEWTVASIKKHGADYHVAVDCPKSFPNDMDGNEVFHTVGSYVYGISMYTGGVFKLTEQGMKNEFDCGTPTAMYILKK